MWLGNSVAVAAKHYLQALDTHFTKATQKATQHTAANGDFETHRATINAKTLEKPRVLAKKMGDTGFDSPPDSAGNVGCRNKSGAHSGARGDSRLVKLIEVWSTLSDDVKGEMLALAGLRPYDVDDFNDVTAEADQAEGAGCRAGGRHRRHPQNI